MISAGRETFGVRLWLAAFAAAVVSGCASETRFLPVGSYGATLSADASVPDGAWTVSLWRSPTRMMSVSEADAAAVESFARRAWDPFGVSEIALTTNGQDGHNWLFRWTGPGRSRIGKVAYGVEYQYGTDQDGFGSSLTAGLWVPPIDRWPNNPMKIDMVYEDVRRKHLARRRVFVGASAPAGAETETVRIDGWYGTGDVEESWGILVRWSADLKQLVTGLCEERGLRPGLLVEYDSEDGARAGISGCWYRDLDRHGLAWKLTLSYGWMRWGEGLAVGFDWKF